MEILANKDTDNVPFIVTRVSGKKTILVVKRKEYTQNLTDAGFQFERYLPANSDGPLEFVEHMHLLKVGRYKVLFRAEADALSNPRNVEYLYNNYLLFYDYCFFTLVPKQYLVRSYPNCFLVLYIACVLLSPLLLKYVCFTHDVSLLLA